MTLPPLTPNISLNGSDGAAQRVIGGVMRFCESLTQSPKLGTHREEFDSLGHEVRGLTERGYLVLYLDARDFILILRVLHGSRQYEASDLVGPLLEAEFDLSNGNQLANE